MASTQKPDSGWPERPATPRRANRTGNGSRARTPRAHGSAEAAPDSEPDREADADAGQRLQALREQSAQARAEVRELQDLLDRARRELGEAQEQAQTVRGQAQQALDAFRQTGEFIASARMDSETVWKQFHESEQKLRALHAQADKVRAELQAAEQTVAQAREERRQARQELGEARREARDAAEEIRDLRHEVEAARDEMEEVRAQLERARRQAREARTALAEAPRPEPSARPGERLIRYLSDAWAVEQAQTDTLEGVSAAMTDPRLRALLEEHRAVTVRQRQALEARLRALGHAPTEGKGFYFEVLTRMWNTMQSPQDEQDRLLHNLMRTSAIEQFEIAMYDALGAYARAAGDQETAELAARHMQEEKEAAARLQPLIAPTAAHIAAEASS